MIFKCLNRSYIINIILAISKNSIYYFTVAKIFVYFLILFYSFISRIKKDHYFR